MNKDFWERIDKLEELAELFADDKVSYGTYIAAANPAMILEMIAELRRLENENSKLQNLSEFVAKQALRLEKEADWLAVTLADASGAMFEDEMESLGFKCSHECEQPGCTLECRKRNWRESARQLGQNRE